MARILREVHALVAAARVARLTNEAARALTARRHGILWRNAGRATRPAVGHAGLQIDTGAIAARARAHAVDGARTFGADLPGAALLAALAAVLEARARIHASPRASLVTIGASQAAFAIQARGAPELGARADVPALAAVADVSSRIEAFVAASRVTALALEVAAARANRRGMQWCRARFAAGTAIFEIMLRVDTSLSARKLPGLTLGLALTGGAYLPVRALLAALSAVVRIGFGVHTLASASRVAGVAQRRAFALHALGATVRRVGALDIATAAMTAIRSHVDTLLTAAREGRATSQLACARATRAFAVQ